MKISLTSDTYFTMQVKNDIIPGKEVCVMKNLEVKDILENIKKMILLQEYEKTVEYIEYIERKKITSDSTDGSIDEYMNDLISNLK